MIISKVIRNAMLASLATLFVAASASGEMYQYEDANGAITFTDNPTKIPKKSKKKAKRERGGSDSSVMPVTIKGNRVVLPVTLNYRGKEITGRFVLDTGAEVSTITPQLADKLDIDPEDTDQVVAQGIGSGYHVTGRAKMDYVLVGPNRKYGLDFIIIQGGGADGLLGMNFLRELRYHVSFDRSEIRWGD
uniref:Aspartyl protease-like protein n=1 Tax=Geobacter sp. (strain M21) TaxID=443144 RepID=C6E6E5_GEOSM